MTIFATQAVVVQRFAIGLFNTVVGSITMGQVNTQVTNTGLSTTLNSYYSNAFGTQTTTAVATTLVTNLGITGAANIATAQAYIVGVLNAAAPTARGQAVADIVGLFAGLTSDPVFGAAATAYNAKVTAADGYAGTANIAAAAVLTPTTQTLTTGVDNLTGTASDDTFIAEGVANSLSTSDRINGGAGNDTLSAIMTTQTFSASPVLTSVEKVVIIAQNDAATDSGDNNVSGQDAVQLDFGRVVGINNIENNNSRADLIVEDVRLEQSKITKDLTITMRDTDPGNVDFGVYFDQLSLRNVSSATSLINLRVLDTHAVNRGLAPLLDSPYGSFTFSYSVSGGPLQVATLASPAIQTAQTFAAMVTALQTAANGVFGAGVVTVTTGSTYTVVDPVSGNNVQGTELVLSATGNIVFNTTVAGSGWLATETVPAVSGLYTSFNTNVQSTTALVTSTIVLDNVGRGSNSGDLVVGGLSVGDTSTSKGVERFDITVEDDSKLSNILSTNNALREVYVVNSTTNRDTNAYNPYVNGAGSLTVRERIGEAGPDLPHGPVDQDGDGFGFTDVRVIDGSAMTGVFNFTAGVTANSLAKYLNRADTAADPLADNVQFTYSGGAANDVIELTIASAAASSSGRLSSQEDAKFTVNGGAGNDAITVTLSNAATNNNEHTAQKTFDNITVNGGDGNDTIRTPGIADMVINAGAGADTIYSDNSALVAGDAAGNRNVWTVDAAASTLDNLLGTAHAAATNQFLWKGQVQVTYASQIGAAGGVTNAAAAADTNGWESAKIEIGTGANSVMSQFHLNQAIKKAINEDATLSKLLKAEDGPDNTLRINSLIDGANVTTGLNIVVSATAPAAASADETAMLTAFRASLNDSTQTAANANAAVVASVANLNGRPGMVAVAAGAGTEIAGTNSANDRDNTIDAGADNDVVVLSSGANSAETIKVVGDVIGTDVIVNFQTGLGNDRLDFNSHLLGKVTQNPAGNTLQKDIAITLNADATVEADSITVIQGGFTVAQTFANLTAANFLTAVNTTGNVAYAGLTDASLTALSAAASVTAGHALVGTTYNAIVAVENNGGLAGSNLGQYKVFKLTATTTNAVVADFTSAVLLGTIDFGGTLAGFDANNLVA